MRKKLQRDFFSNNSYQPRLPFDTTNDIPLRILHEMFLKFKYYGERNSEVTIKGHKDTFELFMKSNPKITLTDLTELTIINFLEFINTRERKIGRDYVVRQYKNSSIVIMRNRLNVFFDWLLKRSYIKTNPLESIPYPKVSYTDRRAFSQKEFEAICYAVNTTIQWANLLIKKRNIALVMFLTFTGVRKEELLELQLSDVDLFRKFVTVRAETSKSKRGRIIPMNSSLLPYLEDYLEQRKSFLTLFFWVSGRLDQPFTENGAAKFMKQISKATKVNCHLHRFRHTFATNYYKQTHDIVGLQKLMGHTSFRMTLSYLRSLPDEHIIEQIRKITIDEFV